MDGSWTGRQAGLPTREDMPARIIWAYIFRICENGTWDARWCHVHLPFAHMTDGSLFEFVCETAEARQSPGLSCCVVMPRHLVPRGLMLNPQNDCTNTMKLNWAWVDCLYVSLALHLRLPPCPVRKTTPRRHLTTKQLPSTTTNHHHNLASSAFNPSTHLEPNNPPVPSAEQDSRRPKARRAGQQSAASSMCRSRVLSPR